MRLSVAVAIGCLTLTSLSAADRAAAAIKKQTNIASQSLGSALKELATDHELHLLYRTEVVGRRHTSGAVGELTFDEALTQLLNGSGLTFKYLDDTTVTILPLADTATSRAGDSSRDQLRIAQTDAAKGTARPQESTATDSSTSTAGDTTELKKLSLEEIVVTATKREERLQDVPAAVTAINADTLARKGLLRITDYQALAPGLNVNDGSGAGGQMSPTIRGITTGAGGRPTVAVFVDDTPIGRAASNGFLPDIDPADLERIEVLRGPQGTLYGGAAMGGLIKFVTKSPEFDAFSGRLEAGGTTIDGGGAGWSARGSFNLPVSENLAVRASAFMREDPGFIDNLQTSQEDFNERRYQGGRIAVGARLSENFDARLSVATQHIEADANPVIEIVRATGQQLCGGVPCQGLVTRRAPGAEGSEEDNTIFDLRLTGDLGWAELTSSSAFATSESTNDFDFSGPFGGLVSFIYGVPNLGLAFTNLYDSERFTQEFRLTSRPEQFLAWQVGAYYTDEKSDVGQDGRVFVRASGDSAGLPPIQVARTENEFEEIAGYGNITLNFSPRFDVTLGARYSENDVSQKGETTTRFGGPNAPVTTANVGESSDNSLTYLINPRYRISQDLMVYGRVATGYRPGGFNAINPLAPAPVPATFGPDEAVNYELGAKTAFPNQSLQFDVALYYIDWTDVQVRQSISGISHFTNAGAARSQGAEAQFSWKPIEHLTFTGNASYNEAELDEPYRVSATVVVPVGTRLPDTPEFASYLGVDYELSFGNQWAANFGAAWRYVGDRVGSLENAPFALPAYDTFDAQVALSNDRYRVMLFARNIADETGYISTFAFPPEQVAIIAPRTFGVTFSVEY